MERETQRYRAHETGYQGDEPNVAEDVRSKTDETGISLFPFTSFPIC
jgi:hypothetical protein